MTTPKPANWTPTEKAYIAANYATAGRAELLAALPGRSWNSIQCRAYKLGTVGRKLTTPPADRRAWHPGNLALLHELYPLPGGPALVAAATGLTRSAVMNCAHRLGLRTPHPVRAKAPKAVRVAKPKAPKLAKPKAPALPQKPARLSTPNANAALSKKRRAEVSVAVKAEDIRRLPPNHPGRWAYATDGIAGWVRWQQGQA